MPALLTQWLDRLDATGRWALLKFLGGAPRVGVSARLAKQAVADAFDRDIDEIEETLARAGAALCAAVPVAGGKAERPALSATPVFRPLMLAHALEEGDWEALTSRTSRRNGNGMASASRWRARVASRGCSRAAAMTSRTSFPELPSTSVSMAMLDGELLVVRDGDVAPFADLQQRLNRKTVTRGMLTKYPAHVRFYDALEIDGEDLRGLAFRCSGGRGSRPGIAEHAPPRSDLSEILGIRKQGRDLKQRWETTRDEGIEGLMLKRKDSPYLAGRPKGHWYKWKRAALTADCVLLYAQKGAGKRSSFYSDYTFGAWGEKDGAPYLVPVGKAYSGFTDAELVEIDRFVRQNTIERFGPVRSVTPKLVLEVAFDAVQASPRHKSGIAMRFPRIARIRWDKPAAEADTLERLKRLIASPR